MVQAIIDGAKNLGAKVGFGSKKGPEAKIGERDLPDPLATNKTNPLSSRAKKAEISKPVKTVPTLKVGPHELVAKPDEIEDKRAKKIATFFDLGKEGKDMRDGLIEKTEANFTADKEKMHLYIPASVAANKLANDSIFKRFAGMFSSFKPNEVIKRSKAGNIIDLVADGAMGISPKKLKDLTKFGVFSYVAFYKKDDKGKFPLNPDLLVPVMDFHMMLEYMKAHPPKGMPKNIQKNYKAFLDKLENHPGLKGMKFVDEALALDAENKEHFSNSTELREMLCCVGDTAGHDKPMMFSSDLLEKGDEAKFNGKEVQVIDEYEFPAVDQDYNTSIVKHPVTLLRPESMKNDQVPAKEIARIIQGTLMNLLEKPEKIKPEDFTKLDEIFKDNVKRLEQFNAHLDGSDSKDTVKEDSAKK